MFEDNEQKNNALSEESEERQKITAAQTAAQSAAESAEQNAAEQPLGGGTAAADGGRPAAEASAAPHRGEDAQAAPREPVYQAGRVYSPQNPNGTAYQQPAFARTDNHIYGEEPAKKPGKKTGISWGAVLAMVLVMTILAGAGGFGGAYLFNRLDRNEMGADEKSILYQSVIRTVSDGDEEGGRLTVTDVASIASPSVVEIVTESVVYGSFFGQYTTAGAGSGVILSKDGLIVTNYHVINGANNITVTLQNGEEYKAELVGGDEKSDVALIRIAADDLTVAVLGESASLVVGEGVVAVGNPLGELGGTVTDGIISALDREIEVGGEAYTLLQTNAAVNPGNSGGGLFNMYGELIGIVNAKISESDVEGLGFAIPIDHAKGIIEELATYGYVRGRVDMGMKVIEINDAATAMYYNVSESGVYVSSVEDTSFGFQPGDLILSIDGTEVITMDDFNKIIEGHAVGDSLSVTVKRRVSRKEYQTVELTLMLREEVPSYIH